MRSSYSVSKSGWMDAPLFSAERRRHQTKVEEAIRQHLADMVTEEKIIVTDGRRALSVPIPEIHEYRIRFDPDSMESVGHAPGSRGGGAKDNREGQGTGQPAKEAGSEPGLDLTETEVSMEEIQAAVFSRLELPNLDLTKPSLGTGQDMRPVSIAPYGLMAHWDRRRTLKQSLLRQAAGIDVSPGLVLEDLRFRVNEAMMEEQGGAVVIAMMDTSGSMGAWEKHLAKALLFWTTQLLRRDYPTVTIVFIAHDVRAKELSETAFFQKGVSGGTVASAAFRLALEILDRRFPLPVYNAYGMYLSDGGNLTSDNPPAQALAADLTQRLNLFAVGELHDTDRKPSMLFTALDQTPARTALLQSDQDLLPTLRTFFHP